MRITHVAFKLGFGNESRNGVNNDNVDRAAANECIRNVKCLFAVVRLGNIELVHADAKLFGINGVKRMFSIDKNAHTSHFLRFGNDMQRNGGFAGGFRPVYFNYSSARNAADAESCVKLNAARRNDGNLNP